MPENTTPKPHYCDYCGGVLTLDESLATDCAICRGPLPPNLSSGVPEGTLYTLRRIARALEDMGAGEADGPDDDDEEPAGPWLPAGGRR